jgi:hypothetical protein
VPAWQGEVQLRGLQPVRARQAEKQLVRGLQRPCPHGKLKRSCVDCKGCPHGKLKSSCADCNPLPSWQA